MQREISNNVEWNQQFTTEEESMEEMVWLRYVEEDTICPKCGHGRACKLIRRGLWQCASSRNHVWSKVEMLFEKNPMSLNKWFVAILRLIKDKGGFCAEQLSKMLQNRGYGGFDRQYVIATSGIYYQTWWIWTKDWPTLTSWVCAVAVLKVSRMWCSPCSMASS